MSTFFAGNTINFSVFIPIQTDMYKYVVFIICTLLSTTSHAAWVLMDDNYGNADEYYDSAISSKGSLSTIRTFMVLPIRGQVPIYDPTSEPKVTLKLYNAEISVYDVDCKKRTVRLTSRSFYLDQDAKILMATYGYKDTFIQESNSRFAQQFKVSKVLPQYPKSGRMLSLACKL